VEEEEEEEEEEKEAREEGRQVMKWTTLHTHHHQVKVKAKVNAHYGKPLWQQALPAVVGPRKGHECKCKCQYIDTDRVGAGRNLQWEEPTTSTTTSTTHTNTTSMLALAASVQGRGRGRGGLRKSRTTLQCAGAIAHEMGEISSTDEGEGNEAKVVEISSIKQLIDNLEQAQDSLVIVSFHAKWCAACRKVQPLVRKEVLEREDKDIVLLKVNYDLNKQICKSLSVKKLPYFHFYRGSQGKLAEFSASAKTFQRIKDAIALHGAPQCTLGDNAVPEALETLYEDLQKKNSSIQN